MSSKFKLLFLAAFIFFAGIVVCLSFISCSRAGPDDLWALTGPYLGQKPPSTEPEIFAPGLITTHYSQSYIAFLNDGRVCVFSESTEKGHETYYTYEKDRHWTKPQRAPFEELQGHPNYTSGPLGRKVYYHSGNPTHPDDDRPDDNIWTIEWTGSGWAEPEVLPEPANSEYGEAYPSATVDGTVYFFTWRREGTRGDDIWFSRCIDGQYQEAERLPWPINTDFIEYDPYVAPDESFLIFGSDRPGGYGKIDNYICFRKDDGSWTPPINLGRPYNSSSSDLCANGSPDGKYFFFTSGRKTDVDKGDIREKTGQEPEEDADLYWADFSFIDELKKTLLTKRNAAEIIKRDYMENGIQSAIDTLNNLYSGQQDSIFFSPFELLSICRDMLTEEKTGDADLFFSSLDKTLPKDVSIKEGYARICAMNGFVSRGLKIFEELKLEDPDFDLSDSLSALGYLFTLYPEKTEEALSVLKFTVEKFPEDPWAYFSLARIYRRLGDLEKAITNCRKSLEIRPNVGDISELLERLLEEQEQKKKLEESFPVLKGPYLGQKPPGMTPELFAPGILNTEKMGAFCSVFSPDGNEFYFVHYERKDDTPGGIAWTKRVNDVWTKPELLHFNSTTYDNDMCMSADGDMLIFRSYRALPNGKKPEDHTYLWFVERAEEGWSSAKPLYCADAPIRTGYPSITKNGILYFAHKRDEVSGIYRSKPVNGAYGTPEHVFTAVEGIDTEGDMFIAPDESYMIISCWNHPDNIGSSQGDLYITFKKEDGTWTEEINMSELINTQYGENCPQVSPDGKYFFFNRYNPDAKEGNIYWVDAKIIDKFKPEELK